MGCLNRYKSMFRRLILITELKFALLYWTNKLTRILLSRYYPKLGNAPSINYELFSKKEIN